jgi:predicted nucleic acid-binding protein
LILVDTSVWVDHLRGGDAQLVDLLERARVVMHPFVVGEMACGSLRNRSSILELLLDLPAAAVAENDEVLGFIERHALHGKGIGYVDVHLLASAALTAGAKLWTRDKKLRVVAKALGFAFHTTSRSII